MRSLVTLGLEQFEIDWGKHIHGFQDFSALFLPSDRTPVAYYYPDEVVEYKDGLSRELAHVVRRLDLLGYSLPTLPHQYEGHVLAMPEFYRDSAWSFETFREVVSSIDVHQVSSNSDIEDYDLGEFVSRYLFRQPAIASLLTRKTIAIDRDFGTALENLDPYITLRLLAENPSNRNLLLQWRYMDVAEEDWSEREPIEFACWLSDQSKILVVTEGSSDTFVMRKALQALSPEIADFFHFIDMEEHYPFTGTGNLLKFCQGLARIRIQNQVLVIFDNDVAGNDAFNRCGQLTLPPNMHICTLPAHGAFDQFRTAGPAGISTENINGTAVSIECFLDLSVHDAEPTVRWTAYSRDCEKYQGELDRKDDYVRAFKRANLVGGTYDTSKLHYLIDYLVEQWISGRGRSRKMSRALA